MMNFDYSIPTVVHFGRGQIEKLGAEIASRSSRVLVVYGGGSVKRNGVYEAAAAQLSAHGIYFTELSGVDPNPKIGTVREGVRLCREQKLDGVLALGGGSAIDCAKAVAAGALYDGDSWDFLTGKHSPTEALPIFTVLTISATGSEMDSFAVISDMGSKEKLAFDARCCLPTCSILDPLYTFSVPARQTAAGTADIMSHALESYFSRVESAYLQDRAAESVLQTCIRFAPIALREPENYEARANLMWASSWAINGFLEMGKSVPWSVHSIEHQLSAYYDITHGIGLAILTPNWMRFVLNSETEHRFAEYGIRVWGLDPGSPTRKLAEEAIKKTSEFFKSIGLPSTLTEIGIDESHFDQMSRKARTISFNRTFVPLSVQDIRRIYEMSL